MWQLNILHHNTSHGRPMQTHVCCGSWTYCIITLPMGVPSRHMYSVFAPDTFIPFGSETSLRCSSSNSSTSFSLAHSIHDQRTSSAKVLLIWCVPSVNPYWWQSGTGGKRILGWRHLKLQRVHVFLQHKCYVVYLSRVQQNYNCICWLNLAMFSVVFKFALLVYN